MPQPVSRFDRCLFFAVLVLLVWLPLPLGSNRDWSVGLLVLTQAWVATQWPAGQPAADGVHPDGAVARTKSAAAARFGVPQRRWLWRGHGHYCPADSFQHRLQPANTRQRRKHRRQNQQLAPGATLLQKLRRSDKKTKTPLHNANPCRSGAPPRCRPRALHITANTEGKINSSRRGDAPTKAMTLLQSYGAPTENQNAAPHNRNHRTPQNPKAQPIVTPKWHPNVGRGPPA